MPGVCAVLELDASADLIWERCAGEPLTATATAAIDRTTSAAPAITRMRVMCTALRRACRPLDPRKRTLGTRRRKAPTRRPRTRRAPTPPSASRLALPAARVPVLGTCGTALACSSNQRSSPSLSQDPVFGSPLCGCVGCGAEDALRSSSTYGSGRSAAGSSGWFSTSSLAGTISEDAKSLTAAGSNASAGTSVVGCESRCCWGSLGARRFSRHWALRAVPSITVPCLSLGEVGDDIPVL